MKLNFVKVGSLVCPMLGQSGIAPGNQELIENVLKCTVTSVPEQETVMTLTVSIPVADVTQTNDNRDVWKCKETECPEHFVLACTHVGSEPRLCAKDRGKTATWKLKK